MPGKGGISPIPEITGQFQLSEVIRSSCHFCSDSLLGAEIAFLNEDIHRFPDGYGAYLELLLDVLGGGDQLTGAILVSQDAALYRFRKLHIYGGFSIAAHGLQNLSSYFSQDYSTLNVSRSQYLKDLITKPDSVLNPSV